tara:strand:- start:63 stop:449 length:387 start_codon:yes stop_codon:yes gene_type:complete
VIRSTALHAKQYGEKNIYGITTETVKMLVRLVEQKKVCVPSIAFLVRTKIVLSDMKGIQILTGKKEELDLLMDTSWFDLKLEVQEKGRVRSIVESTLLSGNRHMGNLCLRAGSYITSMVSKTITVQKI